METYLYIFMFLIGLVVGSFFNVIIFRFGSRDGVITGRSKCLSCQSKIKWFDLVPFVSYLVLKGRCRNCLDKISILYPIVEISTATVLLLLFFKTGVSYLSILNALIALLFTLVVFIDIRYFTIPDKILISLAALIMVSKLVTKNFNPVDLLISPLVLTSFFAILFLVSRGKWIGLGDVKLIFVICLLLGYPPNYLALVSSVWIASIFAITLLATRKASLKTKIPFGSFLAATTIVFIIFNNGLQEISKYLY